MTAQEVEELMLGGGSESEHKALDVKTADRSVMTGSAIDADRKTEDRTLNQNTVDGDLTSN